MSTLSKLKERFGPAAEIRDVVRVASGSPVRLSLHRGSDVNAPAAARVLVRRHVSLRKAHAALSDMMDSGTAYLGVPCVENIDVLQAELGEAGVVVKLHGPQPIDVHAIRERMHLSQEEFSVRFGLDVATVRNWEQNRSRPDAAATTLLWIIARNPHAVERAIEMDVTSPRADRSA